MSQQLRITEAMAIAAYEEKKALYAHLYGAYYKEAVKDGNTVTYPMVY